IGGVSCSVTDRAGCAWKTLPLPTGTAVVEATAGRASVDATEVAEPSGLAEASTSSAFTAAETLSLVMSCAVALEPTASMRIPTTADAARPPSNFIIDYLPSDSGHRPAGGAVRRFKSPAGDCPSCL